MAGNREAVLLMTHFIDDVIVARYRRLVAESGSRPVFVLLNASDDVNPSYRRPRDLKVFSFTAESLRGLGYPTKGRRIRDKDIELFVFPFFRAYTEFDRVWVVEYDVEFTGRWSELFDHFADSQAALLATSLHRHAVNPAWPNWPSVSTPEGPPADLSRFVRAFMPFYRLSRSGYLALDAAYRQGWDGFYEGIVPRILLDAGLGIEDIGGEGEFVRPANLGRFYRSTPADNTLSPGTFVFRPIRALPGPEPGMLWHPVKPETATHRTGWPIKRRQQIVHRATAFARQSMARLGRMLEKP
ncbi:hypothetical protein [Magnetospirillum sp. UT-4]|uniref:hypothetical protein n=1 Tax=Magnetospirillum sp. UT-4 TaxID=2681467 RepID=UPI0013828EB0|nr:hypothetical protein [Magnetospirillum sp. UT-4]CAA7625490.1 conserved hypothetical protein [Magnetospirillum sp. UT-4]